MHNKESMLKAKGKIIAVTYGGKHIRITAGFSMNTLEARRAQSNALQVLKHYDS